MRKLHPMDEAQIEDHRRAADLHPTPEQILSVAAKFEAYLTAPATVLSETEVAQ